MQGSLNRSLIASTVTQTAKMSLASILSSLRPQPFACIPEQEPLSSPFPLEAVRLYLGKKGESHSLHPSPEMCSAPPRQENSDPTEM